MNLQFVNLINNSHHQKHFFFFNNLQVFDFMQDDIHEEKKAYKKTNCNQLAL